MDEPRQCIFCKYFDFGVETEGHPWTGTIDHATLECGQGWRSDFGPEWDESRLTIERLRVAIRTARDCPYYKEVTDG